VSRDLKLDALLSIPALFGPCVSPDGEWVAWSWSRLGPAADVFAAPTDGSRPPLRLTQTVEGDSMVVSWTSEGDAVLVSQDHDGDERVRLFLVRLADPGVMEPLTAASPNHYLRGGQLHKVGRWLIYAANLDAESGQEIEADRLYRHDLLTDERLVLARPEKGSIPWPELNRQGTHVLYSRNDLHPAGQQVWLVDIDGLEDREILNFGPQNKVSASWFPDGRRVLFVAESESYRRLGVWRMDDESVGWLVEDPGRNIEYSFAPPNGGPVVVVGVEQAGMRASLLEVQNGTETPLQHTNGNLIPLAQTDNGGWICTHYDALHPVDLVRYGEDGERASLTGLPEKMDVDEERLVAAAAPICGMTDLAIDYYATRPDLRPYSEEMMGGSPKDVPDRYAERSPINFVRNIKGDLLIVQGLKDPNVTQDNVEAVTEALQRENIPYELLTFEDEGHGIARPKNLRVLYPRLAEFFLRAFDEGSHQK
jgi:Tol biopolymer transport system component